MSPSAAPRASDADLPLLPGSDGIPLYVRVASALRARIFQGGWRIGERLPAFEALATQYGVALNTIRKAIGVLAAESLVSAARGQGTRVISDAPRSAAPALRAAIGDPLAMSPSVAIAVLARELVPRLPPELDEGYPQAERYRRIWKTHAIAGTPFAALDMYIDRAVFGRFPAGAEATQKLSVLMRDHGGVEVVRSREELTVQHADPRLAAVLRCAIAAPVVRLRRWRMIAGGTVVYAGNVAYRSDYFVWDVDRDETRAPPAGAARRATDHYGDHITPGKRRR